MLTLVVALSLVTYRVTRFILEDSLLDRQRLWFKGRLLKFDATEDHELDLQYRAEHVSEQPMIAAWRMKLYELFDCRYCMSIWVGAGAVALTDWQTSVPLPVWVWLSASAGAVITWRWVEQ